MKVFYDPRQTVEYNPSLSPSAGKPAKVLESWQAKFPVEIMPVEPLTREDLYKVHDKQYVDDVLDCKRNNGFDNCLRTIADSLLWTNGSFASAAKHAAITGESCVSPTSGFHHAEYHQGMGFCTFNGLMAAAVKLRDEKLAKIIAIADIDMHYGNGTEHILKKLNMRTEPDFAVAHYTYGGQAKMGQEFLEDLPGTLDWLLQEANVLFYQAGADPHIDDPYGGALTTEELRERDRIVFAKAKEKGVPVVWNLAGGYQEDFDKVLEIHDNTARMHIEIFGP